MSRPLRSTTCSLEPPTTWRSPLSTQAGRALLWLDRAQHVRLCSRTLYELYCARALHPVPGLFSRRFWRFMNAVLWSKLLKHMEIQRAVAAVFSVYLNVTNIETYNVGHDTFCIKWAPHRAATSYRIRLDPVDRKSLSVSWPETSSEFSHFCHLYL